jgi:hypothetical protein
LRRLKIGSVVEAIKKATGNQESHAIFLFGTVVIFWLLEIHKIEMCCKLFRSRCFAFAGFGESVACIRGAQGIIKMEDFTRKLVPPIIAAYKRECRLRG